MYFLLNLHLYRRKYNLKMMIKKTLFFFCLLFASVLHLKGQKLKAHQIEQQFILVDENKGLFASKYEVSNGDYRLFLSANKGKKKRFHALIQYDSTLWSSKFPWSYNLPMTKNYHHHKNFRYFPIVNITKAAAQAYCQWLTKRYNSLKNRKFKSVRFRLPTAEEWIHIATNGTQNQNYNTASGGIKDELGNYEMNIKIQEIDQLNYKMDGYIYTAPVHSFPANTNGFHNLSGNVAEMLEDSEKVCGGHWDAFPDECLNEQQLSIPLPDPRVGFRLVMELIR